MSTMPHTGHRFRPVRHQLLGLFAVCLALAGCGTPVPHPVTSEGASLMDQLANALPSESDLLAYLAARTQAHQAAAAPGLAPASAAPTLRALELTPYLVYPDGTMVPIDGSTPLSAAVDGTLGIVPYEVWYSDATTDFHGFLDVRLVWDASILAFAQATPWMVLRTPEPTTGATISGTIYNAFLDMMSGVTHDNGQLPDVEVLLQNLDDGTVRSTRTDISGAYMFVDVATGATWLVTIADTGWLPVAAAIPVYDNGTWTGVDLDLMPAFTTLTDTTAVYGVVTNRDGTAIPMAAVRLLDSGTGQPLAGLDGVMTNALGEYTLHEVPVDPTVNYIVDVSVFGYAVQSPPLAVTAADAARFGRRVDLMLDNGAPSVVCAGQGAYGSNITVTAAVDDVLQLSIVADDPDGDFLFYDWNQVSGPYVVYTDDLEPGTAIVPIPSSGTYVFEGMARDIVTMPGPTCRVTINVP